MLIYSAKQKKPQQHMLPASKGRQNITTSQLMFILDKKKE